MKHLKYLVVVVLAALILLPVLSACAPAPTPTPTPTPGLTPTPAKPGLPAVPITYPGDTDETIIRRAEWVEGAKKEGRLVIWGSMKHAHGLQLIEEFNKIYPFIKGDYWRGGPDEMAMKLEAEFLAGRHTNDTCLGGNPINYPRWREMGMIAKYTHIIPEIEKMDERMYSMAGDWVMPGSSVCVPIYNTNLVSAAEAPKSWEDLLDPKWKGNIAIGQFTRRWGTMALAEGGWGIAKTEDFLSKLAKQDLIWAKGYTAGRALLIAGDFKVMVENHLHGVWMEQEQGAQLDWVRAEPVIVEGSAFTLQKKAPNPNAVRLFLEWLYSPQGLVVFQEVELGKGCALPGAGTRQSEALKGMALVVQTEETVLKMIELGLTERFDQIIGRY